MSQYLTDVPWYVDIYNREVNLNRLHFRLLHQSIEPPRVKRVCELGFGHGTSLNINSASYPDIEWSGTDLNADHHAFAEQLSTDAGTRARFQNLSFQEYVTQDLPEFDVIVMMGSWSWIANDQRELVVDFVKRKLSPGGIFVFNYICHPGQTHFAAFRQFILDCANDPEQPNLSPKERARRPMEFVAEVMKQNPWYLRANPDIAEFLKHHLDTSPELFAHEYLNENWQPMSFTEVSRYMEKANLQFACQSSFNEIDEDIHLDERQRNFLNTIENTAKRETSADFIRMRSMRCDYWIKKPTKLAPEVKNRKLAETKFAVVSNPSDFSTSVEGTLGKFELDSVAYQSLIQQILEAGVMTLSELEVQRRDLKALHVQINNLLSQGILSLVNDVVEHGETKTFNNTILHNQQFDEINHFASTKYGGIRLSRIDKLFLKVFVSGKTKPSELAEIASSSKLKSPTYTRSELLKKAEDFLRFYPKFVEENGLL